MKTIRRKSIITGRVNWMSLDVTEEQLARYDSGELVQKVFPHLSTTEREFLITGMSTEEQSHVFGEEE